MRWTRSCAVAITSLVVVSLVTACAGWRAEGDTYVAPKVGKRAKLEATYRFALPPDTWRPLREVEDVQVAWIRKDLVGVIELRVQCEEHGDSSLSQYTDHLRIDWDAWAIVTQEEGRLIDRAALHTVVDASLDGVSRRNEMWVVKKNGCLFDLRYSASPSRFKAGQPDFAAVVAGFRFPV